MSKKLKIVQGGIYQWVDKKDKKYWDVVIADGHERELIFYGTVIFSSNPSKIGRSGWCDKGDFTHFPNCELVLQCKTKGKPVESVEGQVVTGKPIKV